VVENLFKNSYKSRLKYLKYYLKRQSIFDNNRKTVNNGLRDILKE